MTEIGVLTIHVKRAEGLKAMDLNGKSDPYVRVHGLHQVAETAVHPKTLDPNSVLGDNYSLLGVLGKGSYGDVYHGVVSHGKHSRSADEK